MSGDKYRPWSAAVLQGCADVLADTETGLTGSEISALLNELRMPDPDPSASKRVRLTAAFVARQTADGNCQRIVTFIKNAMEPAKYVDRPALRTLRQDRLNARLTFVGVRVDEEGQVKTGAASTTLSEAARHATALLTELERRATHPVVLRYCTIELLQRNNFHACLEASKSVFVRLREMAGVSGDGAKVFTKTLALGSSGRPLLAINSLATETEQTEQTGFMNLLIGLAAMYRNPVAHDARAERAVSDNELLELLTTLSMVHRRLDDANST